MMGFFLLRGFLVGKARRLMVVIQIDDRSNANTTFLHLAGLKLVVGLPLGFVGRPYGLTPSGRFIQYRGWACAG